jgi:hypothetical protein
MDERREISRTHVAREVQVLIPGSVQPIASSVRDLTAKGAGLCVRAAILPLSFYLSFDSFRTTRLCRLIWRRREKVGVLFDRE